MMTPRWPRGTGRVDPARPGDPEAEEIYQELADTIGHALLRGDVTICASLLAFPFTLGTQNLRAKFHGPEEVLPALRASAESMRLRKVTDHIRLVKVAWFRGPDLIVGIHETNTLCNGLRDVPPYLSRQTLVRGPDGIWRVRRALHALVNDRLPVFRPEVRDGDVLPHDPEDRDAEDGEAEGPDGAGRHDPELYGGLP